MKKIFIKNLLITAFLTIVSLLQTNSSHAQQVMPPKLSPCLERYQQEFDRLSDRRVEQEKALTKVSVGLALGMFSSGAFLPPLTLGLFLGATGAVITREVLKEFPLRQRVALDTYLGAGKKYSKILIAAKKIRPEILNAQVLDLIQDGFETGAFCEQEKLASWRDIRGYVEAKLSHTGE